MRWEISIRSITIHLSYILILFTFSYRAQAQEGTAEQLLDLPINELLDIKVTTASKSAEDITDAPGIVTVITRQEIQAFAESNLGDILNRAVSTSLLSANIFEKNIIDIRGQSFTPYNNHTLFLINGRPIRDPISGGLNNSLLNTFPTQTIERIEIVRGPGSVLYGSCAYSGVVNIITLEQENESTLTGFELKYGSFNTFEINAFTSIAKKDLQATIGLNNNITDGETFSFVDYNGVDSSANFWKQSYGLFTNISYKDFRLNAGIFDFHPYSLGGVDNAWSQDWADKEHHISYFTDLGYEKKFLEKHRANLNLTNNRHTWHTDRGKLMRATDIQGEITIRLDLGEKTNLLMGGIVGAEEHKSDYFFDGRSSYGSLYFQADYKLTEKIKLIAGLQYNKIQDIAGNTSPRAGLIFDITNTTGIKLLYGQAFRKAYPLETSFNIPQLLGNRYLKPEIIRTSEAQLYINREKYQTSLTIFYSHLSDIIYREIYDDSTGFVQYVNGLKHDFWGAEFEFKYTPTKKILILFSANYQENKDYNEIRNASLHPNLMIKGGVIYTGNAIKIGVYNSYFGEPTQVSVINPNVMEVNKKPSGYSLLSAKISYNLRDIINIDNDFNLFLEGQNLMNHDVRYPEFTTKGLNSLIPLTNSFQIRGGIALEF